MQMAVHEHLILNPRLLGAMMVGTQGLLHSEGANR